MRVVALEEHFTLPAAASKYVKPEVIAKRGHYKGRRVAPGKASPMELLPEIGEKRFKLPPAAVRPKHPHDRDSADEFPQVPGDICRATGIKAFAGYFHHGDRRFRRNPAHFSPDEFVQHQVADHQDALGLRPAKNLLESAGLHTANRAGKRNSGLCRQRTALMRFNLKILGEVDLCGADFCLLLGH